MHLKNGISNVQKAVLNGDKWCGTLIDDVGTVKDGECGKGRLCHDDGLWVTLAKNGNEMVTGQNHNFYSIKKI